MKEGNLLREGDVYRWFYKDHDQYVKNNRSTAYWCMDNQCVVVKGQLYDTYWCYWDKEGVKVTGSNCKWVDPDKVDLEFICNTNEIKYIDKWKLEDYDKVYNLSYQKGYRPIYAVDKGAEVSKKALKNKYQRLLEEAYQKQRSAEFDIERYSDEIEKLGDV